MAVLQLVNVSKSRCVCACSVGGLLLPETPNSLVERGLRDEARDVLIKIRGTHNVLAELEDIVTAVKASQMVRLISRLCSGAAP